ncbi:MULTISPECIES: shikimate kinase [Arcicella]|uniref:Shikimate kinase n=1 Tax=Arcicella aquatica TaxID=217141 RepID=A0ABU5QPS2_9BACT|nr:MULTISPECIES: shikimate kinase [Arcicella]MDR6560301.1 shikimate kinase [Arcicella sp. BE51]MDR6810093.1 shikimate kinase [Arcicella sp. BE140]MDR6821442.1 shikimate kinase [Arcicella sp. BE139]MEA5258775.1 shikimate kinase [Arcicella aquatica]
MKNIFLIGMPSSGKSTLGRHLAKRLDFQFVDMDELIEKQELMTIPEIFKYKGEDYFRQVESKVLKAIQAEQKLVIATGGGVPCFFDNMDFIKANGTSIFLNVQPEDLLKRIQKSDVNHRPLINRNTTEDTLLKSLQERCAARLPYYQRADIQIDGNIDVDQLLWILDEMTQK